MSLLPEYLLKQISTHTPLARRDAFPRSACVSLCSFLLTRLSRGVTVKRLNAPVVAEFLLTRLSRGVTISSCVFASVLKFLLTRLSRGVTRKIFI